MQPAVSSCPATQELEESAQQKMETKGNVRRKEVHEEDLTHDFHKFHYILHSLFVSYVADPVIGFPSLHVEAVIVFPVPMT